MKIQCLQHVAFETPAFIADWAVRRSHPLACARLDLGEPLPSTKSFDCLVVMGGPMNVYEHERYPWLVEEKKLIENAISDGKVVLGVCLGAQMIADALGARVTANPVKEIGWFPVHFTNSVKKSALFDGFPGEIHAFHWHGDTFSPPPGAQRIAHSAACENQAFVYDRRVVGLQFHLEMTPESVRALIQNNQDPLIEGPHCQSAEAMLAAPYFEQSQALMSRLLDQLAALTG